ncbi:hypothetical protein ASE57_06025 [Sphingomonas sp. Leaf11]|nr:hypothetical protein ASE58_06030 [Sphingomonas sp. Leaf9]KQM44234.1 hypothetical protein ASE57_06025 [Sphingomonas sp. Leaf11]
MLFTLKVINDCKGERVAGQGAAFVQYSLQVFARILDNGPLAMFTQFPSARKLIPSVASPCRHMPHPRQGHLVPYLRSNAIRLMQAGPHDLAKHAPIAFEDA